MVCMMNDWPTCSCTCAYWIKSARLAVALYCKFSKNSKRLKSICLCYNNCGKDMQAILDIAAQLNGKVACKTRPAELRVGGREALESQVDSALLLGSKTMRKTWHAGIKSNGFNTLI